MYVFTSCSVLLNALRVCTLVLFITLLAVANYTFDTVLIHVILMSDAVSNRVLSTQRLVIGFPLCVQKGKYYDRLRFATCTVASPL